MIQITKRKPVHNHDSNHKKNTISAYLFYFHCLNHGSYYEKKNTIFEHDVLLIEGYFLKENYDLCKSLCEEFNKDKKLVILTLSAVCIVQYNIDKIKEIANMSDMIIGNMEETEVLAGGKNATFQETYEKVHRILSPRNRLLLVTCGSHGVYCSKYNYKSQRLELILQCFPNFVKNDEIVDIDANMLSQDENNNSLIQSHHFESLFKLHISTHL